MKYLCCSLHEIQNNQYDIEIIDTECPTLINLTKFFLNMCN